MRKTVLSIAVVAAGLLTMSACSGTATPAATGTSGSSGNGAQTALASYLSPATELPVTTPLSGKPPIGKSVYFLSDGTPIGQDISTGISSATDVLGWKTTVLTYDISNPVSINSAMLSAVNAGADAIVFAAVDAAAITEGLAAAQQKGIIVIGDATGNAPDTAGITAEVNSASTAGADWGKLIGLGIAADSERSGQAAHVVEVTAPAFASVLTPIDNNVSSTLTQYCPSCSYEALNIPIEDLFAGNAPQLVISYLQSHPDTTAISIPAAGIMQPGMTAALRAAGLDNIKIYGAAPLEAELQELKAGTATGYAVDPLIVTGWMSVDAIARQLVDKNASVYNTVGTPQWWITQSSDFDPNSLPQVPADYASQFKTLWHVN